MIPVNEPQISPVAKKYILDCLKTGWISSSGKYIELFENAFADFVGSSYAVSTTSGTTALHLALATLGIGSGDEIIIPDLTIISCALAPIYLGAKPVLVDVDRETGNIDPSKIEEKINSKTKAIIVVHLWGHPADIKKIMEVAKKHKLYIIEDACQAHGAEVLINSTKSKYNVWKKMGSLGDIGCFSFYANKVITSGEGGMLVTNKLGIYKKAKLLRDLAHSPNRRFYHHHIGFNFRMTNIQAALGLAQLKKANKFLAKKKWIANFYTQNLKEIPFLELPIQIPGNRNIFWMYTLKIKKGSIWKREEFRSRLNQLGIETREFFIPIHRQPALRKLGMFRMENFPVSNDLSRRGFYIPSGLSIIPKQINLVIKSIKRLASEKK